MCPRQDTVKQISSELQAQKMNTIGQSLSRLLKSTDLTIEQGGFLFLFGAFFEFLFPCFSASLLFCFFASLLLHCSATPLFAAFLHLKPK